jgi:hypothetical protein
MDSSPAAPDQNCLLPADESPLIILESVLGNNPRFRYNAVNFVTAFSKASTQDTKFQESGRKERHDGCSSFTYFKIS